MSKKKSEVVMRAHRRKKEHAVKVFGGKCCICGYNKCINALEFHHTGEKKASPSYVIMRWSWQRAKKELEKCILVCSNCHREIEFKQMNCKLIPQPKPLLTKKCKQCKQQFDTRKERQVYCGDTCFWLSQRKCDRPTKKQLSELLSGHSWTAVGRMFSVSDNAVRKWARRYSML